AVLSSRLSLPSMGTAVPPSPALFRPVKFAVVAPAATVTDAGTVAAFTLLLVRVTTAPPAGAATPRVTAAVLLAPPVTAAGLSVSPATATGGLTVSRSVWRRRGEGGGMRGGGRR